MSETVPEEKPEEKKEEEVAPSAPARHISHSYQDDLSEAMNATDAAVVQELLQTARNQEENKRTAIKEKRQRSWYTSFSFILLFIGLAGGAYAVYRYIHLTVPVVEKVSVGVFPSTDIFARTTSDSLQMLFEKLAADTTLKENTPFLVPIVGEDGALLSNTALFTFLGAKPSEPFVGAFDAVRLGVLKKEGSVIPFIIGSVPDPVVATKEFLIAEPELLTLFGKALGIDETMLPTHIGVTFSGGYRYNLPVRIFSLPTPDGLGSQEIFFYGFATEHVIVVTTEPRILEAVSDTIIRQQ